MGDDGPADATPELDRAAATPDACGEWVSSPPHGGRGAGGSTGRLGRLGMGRLPPGGGAGRGTAAEDDAGRSVRGRGEVETPCGLGCLDFETAAPGEGGPRTEPERVRGAGGARP